MSDWSGYDALCEVARLASEAADNLFEAEIDDINAIDVIATSREFMRAAARHDEVVIHLLLIHETLPHKTPV